LIENRAILLRDERSCQAHWTIADLFRSWAALEAEILTLRQQINVLRRTAPKKQIFSPIDRLIFVCLYRLGVRDALAIVKPETVVKNGIAPASDYIDDGNRKRGVAGQQFRWRYAGEMPLALVISLLVLGTFAFGLIAPNAMQGAMQPLPQIAGAAGAATGCIQMATGAVVSGLVATLNDKHSALSMTALMAACSLLGLVSYLLIARPAERVVIPS
jgi:hypothetical protein